MTKMLKAALTVDGLDLHLSMPFAKVDKENRLVSGFATLDNVDTQDDVVTAEASAKAFKRARGNVREMHEKIAAGRIVDFKEDEYFDQDTGEFYRGMYVTAYISKGAENTWLKVLDGTLSGFSIGGEVKDSSTEFVKEAGRAVRFIKDYDLTELSLVDNPANQLANVNSIQKSIFSIRKAADGSVSEVTGLITETEIENVFYCAKDSTIQSKAADSATCPECGETMEVAGWFEGSRERAEKVRNIINKFLDKVSEGGVEVKKGVNNPVDGDEDETVATGHEEGDPSEVPTQSNPADVEEVDETAGTEEEEPEVDEVVDESESISKKMDELKEDLSEILSDSLEKSREETGKRVEALKKEMEEFKTEIDKKFAEFEKTNNEFGKKLDATKDKLATLEGSLEKLNSADALKKSADLENSAEPVQKSSTWNGAFSIDNLLR